MLRSCLRVGRLSIAALSILMPAAGLAQEPGGSGSTPVPPRDNYYAAGETVDVPTIVSGDVVAAGRTVTLSNIVQGDVLVAGWHVSLTGAANDDVRMAGRRVEIAAPVAGDLTAAGAEVTVTPATHVLGRAWLTGGVLDVKGTFDRELRIAGGTVRLGGEFRQPVHVIAEQVDVLPDARMLAAFTYESPRPMTMADGAVISGPTTYRAISERDARDAHAFRVVSSLFFATHLMLAGLLFLWLMPGAAATLVGTMRSAPARSGLVGLLLVAGLPMAALLLIVTVIGLPVGLTLGALYAVALLIAVLTTALRIGEWEATYFRWADIGSLRQRRLALVAGVLTLAALRMIPGFGTMVVFISVVFGLGAIGLAVLRSQQSAPVAA